MVRKAMALFGRENVDLICHRRIAYKEIFGEFWKVPASERSHVVSFDFDEALFAPGEKCRVSVRALDFFGDGGRVAILNVRIERA